MGNPIPVLIPHVLGGGLSARAKAEGKDYDVFIGGVPFLVKITRDAKYIRETAPVRKEQISTSGPGEESLAGDWIRSQASWHGGAGLLYLDGDKDALGITRYRYQWSRGVWPFEPGELTPLDGMKQTVSLDSDTPLLVPYGSGYVVADDTAVTFKDGSDATVTLNEGVEAMTTDGAAIFAATSTALYSVTGTGSTKMLDLTSSAKVLGWAKARLILGMDNSLYELTPSSTTLPSPLYTHPTPSWRWTFVQEAPQDILVGGYAGARSDILSFRVNNAETPVLQGGAVVASMPPGEQALCMAAISGSVMALGTSEGVRIGGWDQYYSTLTFGPVTVETPGCSSVASWGRFFYAAVSGLEDANDGVVIIDPTTPTDKREQPQYAWTMGQECNETGTNLAVVMVAGKPVIASGGAGVYETDPVTPPVECYIQHSRVRYDTLEPKVFQSCAVTGSFTDSSLKITATSSTGEEPAPVTLKGAEEYQSKFRLLTQKAEWAALRFDFLEKVDKQGFLVRSWQMYAEPASTVGKIVQLPLLCADFEKDARSHSHGYEGFAAERLARLEAAERQQPLFTVQYRNLGPVEAELVTIEKVSYQREHSIPRYGGGERDEGGIILLQLRTIR